MKKRYVLKVYHIIENIKKRYVLKFYHNIEIITSIHQALNTSNHMIPKSSPVSSSIINNMYKYSYVTGAVDQSKHRTNTYRHRLRNRSVSRTLRTPDRKSRRVKGQCTFGHPHHNI